MRRREVPIVKTGEPIGRPPREPFAPQELNDLQNALAETGVRLADVVTVVRRYPRSITAMAKGER